MQIERITQRNVEAITAINRMSENHRTTGETVADKVAAVVGSWTFILIQSAILVAWIALNVVAWVSQWDSYPFILLNLALSFQAAYASPIIMMSQNRQNRLSGRRNQLDLQINLLSEQENTEMLKLLRRLCEKSGISLENADSVRVLEQTTSIQRVVQQIDQAERPAR